MIVISYPFTRPHQIDAYRRGLEDGRTLKAIGQLDRRLRDLVSLIERHSQTLQEWQRLMERLEAELVALTEVFEE